MRGAPCLILLIPSVCSLAEFQWQKRGVSLSPGNASSLCHHCQLGLCTQQSLAERRSREFSGTKMAQVDAGAPSSTSASSQPWRMSGQGRVEILRLGVFPALLTTLPVQTVHANLAGIYRQTLVLHFYSLNSILLESRPSPHLRTPSPCHDRGLGECSWRNPP